MTGPGTPRFPSRAEPVVLRSGDTVATLSPDGAGLARLTIDGREVVWGHDPRSLPLGAQGQVLAPWPNRVDRGRYHWRGRDLQLPLDEPQRSNAIHGLVRFERFAVAERDRSTARLVCRLPARPWWPFDLGLALTYVVVEGGLTLEVEAANLGDEPLPFGFGFHPYLIAAERVDDVRLTLPAERVLRSDERLLPVGEEPVEGTELDFRAGRLVGAARLNHAFGDLRRDEAAMAVATVSGEAGSLRLEVDGSIRWFMVYTGDDLPAPLRRRALAVEPMTCPPNAFSSGIDLFDIGPGEERFVRLRLLAGRT